MTPNHSHKIQWAWSLSTRSVSSSICKRDSRFNLSMKLILSAACLPYRMKRDAFPKAKLKSSKRRKKYPSFQPSSTLIHSSQICSRKESKQSQNSHSRRHSKSNQLFNRSKILSQLKKSHQLLKNRPKLTTPKKQQNQSRRSWDFSESTSRIATCTTASRLMPTLQALGSPSHRRRSTTTWAFSRSSHAAVKTKELCLRINKIWSCSTSFSIKVQAKATLPNFSRTQLSTTCGGVARQPPQNNHSSKANCSTKL